MALTRIFIVRFVRNLLVGAILGRIWFELLFLVYAASLYIPVRMAGTFYWDLFTLQLLLLRSQTPLGWMLPLLGAVAAARWPAVARSRTVAVDVPSGAEPLVVMVHGTFAGDEDAHDRGWWQPGGPLERVLSQAASTPLAYWSFRWSGVNSEHARLAAARVLYAAIRTLERQRRPYHLVAHSHGGGVVWKALIIAAASRRGLEYLQTWTTIGTPFLKVRAVLPRVWHLLPLAVLGTAFFFPRRGLLAVLAKTNAMWSIFLSFEGGLLAPLVIYTLAATAAALTAIIGADLVWRLAGLLRNDWARRQEAAAIERFGSRHLAVASAADEAIHALRASAGLEAGAIRIVPGMPYLNDSLVGKACSPLTFAPIAMFNAFTTAPLNGWVLRLVRNKILGIDRRGASVRAVSALPHVDAVGSSLGDRDEAALQLGTTAAAGAGVQGVRDVLGAFAAGSPLSVALERVDHRAFGALVHNSYFSNGAVANRISDHILGRPVAREWRRAPESGRRSLRELAWQTGIYQALPLGLVCALLWLGAALVYETSVIPRTTSSRLAALVDQTNESARYSNGDEARIWYATLCSIGRCRDGLARFDPAVLSDDHLQAMLESIRWHAACSGAACKGRDELLRWVATYVSERAGGSIDSLGGLQSDGSEDVVRRFWMVARAIGGLRQVPDVLAPWSDGIKAAAVTQVGPLQAVSREMESVWTTLSKPSNAKAPYRSRILYAKPLSTLRVTPEEFRAWDADVPALIRLTNKIDLADAAACRTAQSFPRSRLYADAEFPVESVERLTRSPRAWWDECDQHLAIARAALEDAARVDLAGLPKGLERTRLLARYWMVLSTVRSDVALAERTRDEPRWGREVEERLRREVEGTISASAKTDWFETLQVMQAMGGMSARLLSDRISRDVEAALVSRVPREPDALAEMMRVCVALRKCTSLKAALVHALDHKQETPAEWEEALLGFSVLVGPRQYCDTHTAPCNLLRSMNSAWAMRDVSRAAAEQTLRAAKNEQPFGFDGLESQERDISKVFTVEGTLRSDLASGPGQRLSNRAASRMYAEAARGVAAVGKFQQALQYIGSITIVEDRLMAASEVLLRHEQLRRALGTTDLDFVADWGNRDWDEARRKWIRENPSH